MSDGEQACPAYGKPDSELPAGHNLAPPANGSEPSCSVVVPGSRILHDWLWSQRIAPPPTSLITGLPRL